MLKNLFIWIAFLPAHAVANIIECKDESGKTIYADNRRMCASTPISKTPIVNSFPSTAKSLKGEINYRYPLRNYGKISGRWDVYYEAGLKGSDPVLFESARSKLEKTLSQVEQSLPLSSMTLLKPLKIYLLWGEASPLGGKKSGMRYVRKGEPEKHPHYDARWEDSIIIYSAKNLVYLSDLWTKKALTHEFSHAWHILNWPDKYSEIYIPWKNSKNRKLYINVKDIKGELISSAYAGKNNLEYFAELSAIYFVGGNYYPFDRVGLQSYDLQGYQMVEELWGVN